MKGPVRRTPQKRVYIAHEGPTVVFVTVCTAKRLSCLANDKIHAVLRKIWFEATGWMVGRYVIMPDHVHFFAAPGSMDCELETWTKYWKSKFSNDPNGIPNLWQADSWHHRIRNLESCQEKWQYIVENPVRKGLVQNHEDWPYQGEIHEISWW